MWAVPVEPGATFAPGRAIRLFANQGYTGRGKLMSGRTYDVAPDGGRFLMVKAPPLATDASAATLVVVLNWFEELKRAVPVNTVYSREHRVD
jgi:hypothetical protein